MSYQGIPTQSPDSEQDTEEHYDYGLTIQALHQETKNTKQPYFYAHSKFFGNPNRIFVVFELIMLCIFLAFIVTTTVGAARDNPDLYTFLVEIVVIIPVLTILIIEIILLCSLWLCSKSKIQESLIYQNSGNDKETTEIYHGKKFRDDFRFRLEAALMTIVYLLAIVIERMIGTGVRDITPGSEEYNVLLLRSVIITAVAQTAGILVQVIVPYYTLKQNLARFTEKNLAQLNGKSTEEKKSSNKSITGSNGNHLVSLLDVLSHKYGFFLFMDQLVQELSFENLAFLIEVYQYKFIELQDMVREYKKNGKLRSYFRKRSKKHKMRKRRESAVDGNENNEKVNHDNTTNELQPVTVETTQNTSNTTSARISKSMGNVEMAKLEPDTDIDVSAESNTMESPRSATSESDPYSLFDEYSAKKDFSDSKYYSSVLNKMPWHGLPLTAFITSTNDKLVQAKHIYAKYIDRNSYDSLNCSYDAVTQISESMRKLILWKDTKKDDVIDAEVKIDIEKETKEQNEDKDETKFPRISAIASQSNMTNVSSLAFHLELDELDNIKDDKQWDEILLKVFDAALPDIFANLEDSMMRFRYTKEFLSLIGTK